MNVLSTRIHGILDYLSALLMFSMPWLMDFGKNSSAYWLLILVGSFTLLYSLCTDYEFGFLEEIEIRTHLLLDFLVGVVLMVSPWLFGFYDKVYLPYLGLGMIAIATTILTKVDGKISEIKNRKHQTVKHA